jgi:hypothetical protein
MRHTVGAMQQKVGVLPINQYSVMLTAKPVCGGFLVLRVYFLSVLCVRGFDASASKSDAILLVRALLPCQHRLTSLSDFTDSARSSHRQARHEQIAIIRS